MIRKMLIAGGAALAAIALTGGSAFAFHCFNASLSENAHAASGRALVSLEEILTDPEFVGLCPDGVDHVLDGLEEEGFRSNIVINFRAVMGGGLEKSGDKKGNLQNDKGIDHLTEEFFETVDPLIGEGFALCPPPEE